MSARRSETTLRNTALAKSVVPETEQFRRVDAMLLTERRSFSLADVKARLDYRDEQARLTMEACQRKRRPFIDLGDDE